MATTTKKRTSKRVTVKKVQSGVINSFLTVGGLFLGHLLTQAADKVFAPAGNNDDNVSGIGNLKQFVSPLILLFSGIIGPEFTGDYAKYARPLGAGIAAYGGAKTIKEATGASVLSGTGNGGFGLVGRYQDPPAALIPDDLSFSGAEISL